MLRLIPIGEGKAKLVRNKRGGVRLKLVYSSNAFTCCHLCWIGNNVNELVSCIKMCSTITGSENIWFERDDY